MVQSYRELEVWKRGIELAAVCYQATKLFPPDERYGMVVQIRRAAVSVPANSAEGHGRSTTGEYLNFLGIARGSVLEVETHVIICQRVGLLDEATANSLMALTDEVSRMLTGLRRSLESKRSR